MLGGRLKPDQILILTAVEMETRALRKGLRGRGPEAQPMMQTVGIRACHLPNPSQLQGIAIIIACGLGGALEPHLAVGDVILDDSDCPLADHPSYRRGKIHTASEMISTPVQKQETFSKTGALAVDMEQSIIRHFALPMGIQVLGLRSISDAADQTLDPAVIGLVDDFGRPRPMRIAATLLRRPVMIPYLMRLNASTQLALKNLGTAMSAVLDQLASK